MTNTNNNTLKSFDQNKPKSIIQNFKNIDNVSHKIMLEVMNEIKLAQKVNVSSDVHPSYDSIIKHEIGCSDKNLINIIQCTYGVLCGFCKCCGNFTDGGLRRRRFH